MANEGNNCADIFKEIFIHVIYNNNNTSDCAISTKGSAFPNPLRNIRTYTYLLKFMIESDFSCARERPHGGDMPGTLRARRNSVQFDPCVCGCFCGPGFSTGITCQSKKILGPRHATARKIVPACRPMAKYGPPASSPRYASTLSSSRNRKMRVIC